ncbi:MAG: hypothetical protein QXR84_00290 [Candidatus Bathyarchaeia archaeon]|nr:hypothetical protein [Candidatus Bathyarchaeota archaeon]
MEGLGEEKVFVVEGAVSLLLLLITIIVCLFSGYVPEEKGVISASICASIVLFFSMISVLGKEGVEGFFYALVGSFMAWLALTLIGSRLAFDPNIGSYFLSSLVLSIILSLSGILYMLPENLSIIKGDISLKKTLTWFSSIVFTTAVNFMIIYWLPKIV